MKNLMLVLMLAFLISACSPVNTNMTVHVLNTVPCVETTCRTHGALLVAPPTTNVIYNRSDMIYSLCPHQLSYFAKNRWAATPGQMLQPLIVQTLQDTHHFYAVSSSPVGNYDYILDTQVMKLEQEFSSCSSKVSLVVLAQIINVSSGQIVAAKQFCAVAIAPQRNPCGGAIAANRAAADILSQLACFVVRNI